MNGYEIYIILAVVMAVILVILVILLVKNQKFKTQNELIKENFIALRGKFDEILTIKDALEDKNAKLTQINENLENKANESLAKASILQDKIDEYVMRVGDLESKNATLSEQNRIYNEKFYSHFEKIEQDRINQKADILKSFDDKLAQISAQMLNENTEKIGISSQNLVTNALQNQILPLKAEIEKYQKLTNDFSVRFETNFNNLKSQTQDIIKEASNLASALKSDKKQAGNWGEIQLEKVLENSGLVRGQNYQTQYHFKDDNGNSKFIDVLVHFDEEKSAIIDSKCSLVNFSNFYNAQNDEDRQKYAKALAVDIKNHIDIFNSKDYQSLRGTYEYVFMFIPNENILATALLADPSLYQYGYEKGVFITTPLTLLMALKTIYICWKNLKSDENAMKIFEESGKLYDKISDFISTFETIQDRLGGLNKAINDASTKLFAGRGNIKTRTENLKSLGAKTSKKIDLKRSENLDILELS